ncbi:MAG TPA: hypothetical protein VIX63_15885 [Vicinamibacterales bacterium]
MIRDWRFVILVLAALAPCDIAAQTATGQPAPTPVPAGWQWTTDGRVFFGFNYQLRKFTDFSAWESQNWITASGERPIARGTLRLASMFSFEPFTMRDIGSPQVFQTGEMFRGAPIIDYQHPHDLVMGLGAEYRRPLRRVTLRAGVDLVGTPTLGPPVFMHRPSAAEIPPAPLSHHHLDSSHITPGVVRGGLEAGAWRFEGSWFRGREPDSNRTDLDLGALDSAAVRVSWIRGAWSAQISGAYLKEPEAVTPFDAKKLTASIGRTGGRLAWLAAFGQKREVHGNLEAYLFEATLHATVGDIVYTRIESVAKDILDVGFHRGAFHRHRQSQIGALTVGYLRDVWRGRGGSFGIGADVTGYLVPANLEESYGSPVSFHVFARYRLPAKSGSASHVH